MSESWLVIDNIGKLHGPFSLEEAREKNFKIKVFIKNSVPPIFAHDLDSLQDAEQDLLEEEKEVSRYQDGSAAGIFEPGNVFNLSFTSDQEWAVKEFTNLEALAANSAGRMPLGEMLISFLKRITFTK